MSSIYSFQDKKSQKPNLQNHFQTESMKDEDLHYMSLNQFQCTQKNKKQEDSSNRKLNRADRQHSIIQSLDIDNENFQNYNPTSISLKEFKQKIKQINRRYPMPAQNIEDTRILDDPSKEEIKQCLTNIQGIFQKGQIPSIVENLHKILHEDCIYNKYKAHRNQMNMLQAIQISNSDKPTEQFIIAISFLQYGYGLKVLKQKIADPNILVSKYNETITTIMKVTMKKLEELLIIFGRKLEPISHADQKILRAPLINYQLQTFQSLIKSAYQLQKIDINPHAAMKLYASIMRQLKIRKQGSKQNEDKTKPINSKRKLAKQQDEQVKIVSVSKPNVKLNQARSPQIGVISKDWPKSGEIVIQQNANNIQLSEGILEIYQQEFQTSEPRIKKSLFLFGQFLIGMFQLFITFDRKNSQLINKMSVIEKKENQNDFVERKGSFTSTSCASQHIDGQLQSPTQPIIMPQPLERSQYFFLEDQKCYLPKKINRKAVSWLISVSWSKDFTQNTLFSAILLYYAYNIRKKINKEELGLLLAACLNISAKFIEKKSILCEEYRSILQNPNFQADSLAQMEANLLSLVEYNLLIPNTLSNFFSLNSEHEKINNILYVCELFMLLDSNIFFQHAKIQRIAELVIGINMDKDDKQTLKDQIRSLLSLKQASTIKNKYSSKIDTVHFQQMLSKQ